MATLNMFNRIVRVGELLNKEGFPNIQVYCSLLVLHGSKVIMHTCDTQRCFHGCRKGNKIQYQAYPFASLEVASPLTSSSP